MFYELMKCNAVVLLKDLAITGKDLLNNHIAQGKEVSLILNTLLDEIMQDIVSNTKMTYSIGLN